MPESINKKRIVKNTIFLYAKTFITMLIALYSTRLVLYSLGAVDFGVFATVGGSIAMLESLNGAMTQATQRFINYAEGKQDANRLVSIFNNSVLLHLMLGLAILMLMVVLYFPFFNGIFSIPQERMGAAKFIYLFLAVSTFFTIITVPYDAMINAHEDFLYYSVVGIFISILKLGAAIVVVYYMSDRLILYGLLMALIAVLNMLIMRVYCRLKYSECCFSPSRYRSVAVIKELGAFAGLNFIGAISSMAGNHGSTIIMNHFFGPIVIGSKNIGDQICSQVNVLTYNMTKALNPVIMKSEGGGNREAMLRLSLLSCRYSFFLYLLLAVPFLYHTDLLLGFWLKEIPDWAVLFCQLQVIRTLLEQLFVPLRTSLMAQGSVKEMNLADLFLGLLTFVVLWGCYTFGAEAYWHYYVSIVFLVFLSGYVKIYLCSKKCGMSIRDYLHDVALKAFSTSLFVFSLFSFAHYEGFVKSHSWTAVVLTLLITFVLIIVNGTFEHEKRMVLNLIKKLSNS